MLKRFVLRVSSALLRRHTAVHRRIDAALARPPVIRPYVLRPHRQDAPIRLVHVNGNFLVGGTTQLIVDLIERLSDAYAQAVVVPEAPNSLPYQPVQLTVASLNELQPLYAAWSREPPALVHVQYWVREGDEFHPVALWYDALFRMCERLGVPMIQNVNVPTRPHPSPAVIHNVYVSGYVRDLYDPGHVPSSVIYPGSDFTHFAAEAEPPDDVIGMVYRLDTDKLNERSIEVFIEALRRRPSLRCLIVGGGTYLDFYRRRTIEEGVGNRFDFTGYVSYAELPSLYRRLSIFVAPVHNESFGQVTPFAMSMGLPVAGFDVGALGEQLGGKETLVPAGDVVQLAKMIVDLCADRGRRLSLGAANRRRAHELFAVETMAARYRALYDEVTETRKMA